MGESEMTTEQADLTLTPVQMAEFYIPLVKEYADKLTLLGQQAREILLTKDKVDGRLAAARIIDLFRRLKPSLERLLHRSATLLDHGEIGPDLDLKLALLQHELEASYLILPEILADLEKSIGSKQIRGVMDRISTTVLG
jgi:hypothetical protein